MIAFFLAPFYLLFCGYVLYRGIHWMGACHKCFKNKKVRVLVIAVYVFLVLSLLLAFILPMSSFRSALKRISNYWLGTLLYVILTLGTVDLIRLILKKCHFPWKEKLFSQKGFVAVGTVCVAVILGFSFIGITSAKEIRVTKYETVIEKKAGNLDNLHIVLAADLHLGYNTGNLMMEQMVRKINNLNPDLVIIAGDIFDNEYEAMTNPEKIAETLRKIQSVYGVYACYGNHDVEEKILAGFTFGGKNKESDPRMDQFLEEAGIKLLMDEGVLLDDAFYVYGRPDYEKPGRGIDQRKTPKEITEGMDRTKPVIIIDHEPRELEELSDAGADLDLCGHTHDGQTFPGNIITSLLWENSCGYLKKGEMHNIVTSGVGVFGPGMRVGTKSEICSIKVNFT